MVTNSPTTVSNSQQVEILARFWQEMFSADRVEKGFRSCTSLWPLQTVLASSSEVGTCPNVPSAAPWAVAVLKWIFSLGFVQYALGSSQLLGR